MTEMEQENPILNKGFAVAGRIRHLTCISTPSPDKPKKIPAAIEKLIAELGFRYRPTSQADLQAHAAALALLALDLHDMPAHLLERAIAKHVMASPYLPKASDLVAIAKTFVDRTGGAHGAVGETIAERGNRMMPPEFAGKLKWFADGEGGAYLDRVA